MKEDGSDLDRRVSMVLISSLIAFFLSQLNVALDNRLIICLRSYRASIQFVLSYDNYARYRRNFSRDTLNKHEGTEQERENVGL